MPPLTATVPPDQALGEPTDAGPQEGDAATIDLFVAFTPAARDAAGSDAAMEARIALAVTETNLAYATSGVTQRLRWWEPSWWATPRPPISPGTSSG